MKKALAFLAAAALVSAAFAEDAAAPALKVSGALKTGIQLTGGDSNKTGSAKLLYNDDEDITKVSRFDINGSFDAKDYGVEFRFRQQNDLTTAPTIRYAYVWGSYVDGKVKVEAGHIQDFALDCVGFEGYGLGVGQDDGNGALLLVKPVAGLTLGVESLVPTVPTDKPGYTTKQLLNELGFGAAYSTDVFGVQAGYQLDSDADDEGTYWGYTDKLASSTTINTTEDVTLADGTLYKTLVTTTVNSKYAGDKSFAYFGFNYAGVKNLTVIFESLYENLGAYSDIGVTTLDEQVEYAVSAPLKVGVYAYQISFGDSDYKTIFNFKPYAKYALNDKATVIGKVFYEKNSNGAKNVDTFWFQPGVTYAVGKATIGTYYRYTIADINDKGANGKTVDHALQLNFVWKF